MYLILRKNCLVDSMPKIKNIYAREILNSKGIPTVEATILLDNNMSATGSSPTGTSVGRYEAKDLRDEDQKRFNKNGVRNAVSSVLNVISPALVGIDVTSQHEIDKKMIEVDGTRDKSKLGANAILAVSIASAKAGAMASGAPLFAYLRRYTSLGNTPFKIPTPAFNILNGGKHAGNNLDFQEFLVILASSIYYSLKETLKFKNEVTLIGDEGGFAPSLKTNKEAVSPLAETISESSYRINYDVFLGIDAASNSFYEKSEYKIKDQVKSMKSYELIEFYKVLNKDFNLIYLEDPFADDDWEGWQNLTNQLSQDTLIVGDDLICTNIERLETAIQKNAVHGIIIKPNQIGTVIEAIATAEVARRAGFKITASHRSGETNDDFIADFSVAIDADYVKFGAPARGERVAKYNRLLAIQQQLSNSQPQ